MSMIEAYRIGVELVLGGNMAQGIEALMPGLTALDDKLTHANAEAKGLASSLAGIGKSASGIGAAATAMERLHAATAAAHRAAQAYQSGGAAPPPHAAPPGYTPAAAPLRLPQPPSQNGAAASTALALSGYGGNSSGHGPNFRRMPGGGNGPGLVPVYTPNFTMPTGGGIPLYPNGYPPPGGGGGAGGGSAPRRGGMPITEAYNAFMLGRDVAHGAEDIFRPAIDLEKITEVLSADMRLTPDQVKAAVARARETTRLAPGSEAGENMASLLDLKTVFGSLDEANKLLPDFAKMQALFSTLDRRSGGKGDQAFAAAKAMEILGEMTEETVDASGQTTRRIDPEKGMEHLRMMQRVAVATNMRVSPKDYLSLAKSARVAGMTLDDEFVFQQLPAIIQTEGASRTGTALMSAAQVFRGGKLTDKSAEAMIAIGLAANDAVEYHVGGHMTNGVDGPARMVGGRSVIHEDKIYDMDLLAHNPLAYVDAASKRMDAANIHGSEAQIAALMKAAQRSPIAGLLAVLLKDQPAIRKEQDNIAHTDPAMATRMGQETTAGKAQQLQAAFHNMLTDIGGAGLGDVAKILETLTAALNHIGQWAHDNPEGAKAAMEGLAFGLAALGAAKVKEALMLLGSPKGGLFMLAGGILALSGALDKVPSWLADMAKGAIAGGAVGGLPGAIIGGGAGAAAHSPFPAGSPMNDPHLVDNWLRRQFKGAIGQTQSGGGVFLQSYHGPETNSGPPIHLIVYSQIDGKTVAKSVTQHQTRMIGGQLTGMIRPDQTVLPQYGAHQVEM